MEELFKAFAGSVALGVEVVAVLIIAYGAVEALVRILGLVFRMPATHGQRKEVWRRFGGWLLLGLEFELASDIIRTVISPNLDRPRAAWSDRRHPNLSELLSGEGSREVRRTEIRGGSWTCS
jgi:uncharacterized membrane protein